MMEKVLEVFFDKFQKVLTRTGIKLNFTYLFSNKQVKLFSICLEQLACDFR